MSNAYTFIGTTDEVTQCGCCGRDNLKGTVVLKTSDGDFVFFGSTCGAKALGWTVKDFNAAANNAQKERINARRIAENTHPNRTKINALLNKLNAISSTYPNGRMSYSERKEHPIYKEVQNLTNNMREDLNKTFGF